MGRDLPRCISEPRLSRDKLSHSTSLDSLATPAMPNILREVLYRKLDTKTNILQSKWVKNWAVLQDNTLYIYADSKETDSVIVCKTKHLHFLFVFNFENFESLKLFQNKKKMNSNKKIGLLDEFLELYVLVIFKFLIYILIKKTEVYKK